MIANCLAPAIDSESSQDQPSSSNIKEDNVQNHVGTSSTNNSPQEEPVVLHHVSSRLQ